MRLEILVTHIPAQINNSYRTSKWSKHSISQLLKTSNKQLEHCVIDEIQRVLYCYDSLQGSSSTCINYIFGLKMQD